MKTPVLNEMYWLVKREFWEHRGGFLWTPVIVGGVFVLLNLMGIVTGEVIGAQHGIHFMFNDNSLLNRPLNAEDLSKAGLMMDLVMYSTSFIISIVLGFVVFFYCLGALYDDRRDRSVLFWKSMPLSDTQTVLSKLVSAVVVAPVLATLAAIVTMFGFIAMISIVVLAHGGNPVTLIWGPSRPFTIAAGLLCWVPVYALWALPTVGWLLLCSAWAKSKPFLWAVMLPVFSGVIVSWFGLMELFDRNTGWFWAHVVGRLLLGTFPGIELAYQAKATQGQSLQSVLHGFTPADELATLASPQLWIGAVVGVLFVAAAIWLRQRRDEI